LYSPLYGAFSPYYYSPFAYPYYRGYHPYYYGYYGGYYTVDPGGGGGGGGVTPDQPSGRGRVVDGQGYTRVSPRDSEPVTTRNGGRPPARSYGGAGGAVVVF